MFHSPEECIEDLQYEVGRLKAENQQLHRELGAHMEFLDEIETEIRQSEDARDTILWLAEKLGINYEAD